MKKLMTLLSIVLIAIVSCSKDTATESIILPKRIISSGGGDPTSTVTLTYNGNKLIEINRIDGKSVYTYNGDLITKEEEFEGTRLTRTKDYTYENNNLKSYITVNNNLHTTTGNITLSKKKYVYTYNSNSTVLQETFDIDNSTGLETKRNGYTTRTYINGNMTKEVEYSSNTFFNGTTDVTNTNTYTTIYEYDTKNNPLKNVVGLNKIFISEASLNNVVRSTNSSESTTAGTANPVQPTRVRNYELTYNSNDFLTESKYITTNTSGAVTSSTQFFYD